MPTAALHNLGCKVNSYETDVMQQMLEEAGYEIKEFNDVCGCTFRIDNPKSDDLYFLKKILTPLFEAI